AWVDGAVPPAGIPTVGFQPTTAPCSVTNRKNAAAVVVPSVTGNAPAARAELNTVPVCAPPGIDTKPWAARCTMAGGRPSWKPLYSELVAVPLCDTQMGEVGLADRPQALTSCGSVTSATPGWSDTRLV